MRRKLPVPAPHGKPDDSRQQVLNCLTSESRREVDDLAAGGYTKDQPEDFGFMVTHNFVDPDGHGAELLHVSAPPPEV